MRNKYSHITNEHLIFLNITGEELAKMLINELGTIRISMYPIKEYLNKKEIMKSLESNKPVKQIAKEVGVHLSTIYEYIQIKYMHIQINNKHTSNQIYAYSNQIYAYSNQIYAYKEQINTINA